MGGCLHLFGNGLVKIKTESMIKNLKFDNFKCLSGKSFDLSKINLFTGYNGRGKSSVIQLLLLLAQSTRKNEANGIENLHLNGKYIQLGDFDELLYDDSTRYDFGIDMVISPDHKIHFSYEMGNDFKIGHMSSCIIDTVDYFDAPSKSTETKEGENSNKELMSLPVFINSKFGTQNVHYVSANRQGPVKFVEKEEKPEFYSVGADGSKTINTLSNYFESIDDAMNVDSSDKEKHSLGESVSMWIDYIMNGGSVSITGADGDSNQKKKSAVLQLGFGMEGRTYNSYNVGFGYSYILSIVVTALIAKEGNIVIIENPEAHLHPEAQTRLTFLLAKLAARNVQVFVETHSEHVINGIRLAALKEEFILNNNDIKIFFFNQDFTKTDLIISENGRIPNWPSGFFDQYQKELAEILKLGSQKKIK